MIKKHLHVAQYCWINWHRKIHDLYVATFNDVGPDLTLLRKQQTSYMARRRTERISFRNRTPTQYTVYRVRSVAKRRDYVSRKCSTLWHLPCFSARARVCVCVWERERDALSRCKERILDSAYHLSFIRLPASRRWLARESIYYVGDRADYSAFPRIALSVRGNIMLRQSKTSVIPALLKIAASENARARAFSNPPYIFDSISFAHRW